MKKIYNLSNIMTSAWAIRRSAAESIGCKTSDVVMAECLRMAWAEAEGVNAEVNALEAAAAWNGKDAEEQALMVRMNVRKAAKYIAGTAAILTEKGHDFNEFFDEAFAGVLEQFTVKLDGLIRKNEKRAANYKRPLTLVSIVYGAAKSSIQRILYADRKHGVATEIEITDEDGNAASYLETMCADAKQNTERAAMIRVGLRECYDKLDDKGKRILELLSEKRTEREIAKEVEISNVAVHKRIVKMRRDLDYLRAA